MISDKKIAGEGEKNSEPDTEIIESDTGEEISDEDVVYQINTYGADFTVDGLVKRFDRGDIFRPEFQRNYVWTWRQASRFIESILLGLPIPSVFLYKEESTQKLLIVDGLQRLTTLHAFHQGRFPNNKVFKLKGVNSRFEGRTINELEGADKRRIEDSVIHAMIIQQMAPQDDKSSVFHIFDRLNSGGTPLQPQEIRAAIYHGPFQESLGQFNENEKWRDIFGPVHKRSKDQELILRFLALSENSDAYEAPMKAFLNNFMSTHRNADKDQLAGFDKTFSQTIERAHNALGKKAFRLHRSMNVAVFDAVMVAINTCSEADSDAIKQAYRSLKKDKDFRNFSSESTSSVANVHGRIKRAIEAINAAC